MRMVLRGFTCLVLAFITCLCMLACFSLVASAAQPGGYLAGVGHSILASPDGALDDCVMSVRIYNITGTSGNNILYVGSGNTQPDWDDLYFCDAANTIRYPHWIDWSNSGPNYVTVYYNISDGVPTQGKQINVYYSNPAATNSENPYAVFKLFDDFSGPTINTTTWQDVTDGHYSFNGGAITITANDNTYRYLRSIKMFPTNYELKARLSSAHFQDSTLLECIRYNSIGGIAACYAYTSTTFNGKYFQGPNPFASADILGWSANTMHVQEIIRDSHNSQNIFKVDSANTVTLSQYYENDTKLIDIIVNGNTAAITVDYVYVTPYTANPPTDGSWGTTYADTMQAVKFGLTKIDLFGLSIGATKDCTVNVYDVNNNLYSTGKTGTDGSASFMLYRTQYYMVQFINSSQGIDKSWSGYPTDTEYSVYVWPWEFNYTKGDHGVNDRNQKIKTFAVITPGYANIYYNDTGSTTTACTMTVYKRLNMTTTTLIDTFSVSGNSNFSHNFSIPDSQGQDYKVVITSTQSNFDNNFTTTLPWTFPGMRYSLPGMPASGYVWIGFLLPLFVALTVSFRNVKFGPIVFCAMSWGFTTMGWMSDLGLGYPLILTVATFISIIFIFNIKQREGY